MNWHGMHRTPGGVDERTHGPFTALGHGKTANLGIAIGILNPPSHSLGRLHGGQALFEGVGGA